ncbi:MAG: hypothetical protein SFV15_25925 [Polyangiaceae bacterium]|nr:hypothetical protein [Polyangiaceae bacterium]
MRATPIIIALLLASMPLTQAYAAKPEAAAAAGKAGKQKKTAKAPAAKAGVIGAQVGLTPKSLKWGMDPKAISKVYEKVLDREYLPLYRKTEPGVEMRALDVELQDKKALILRNVVEFGALPTGIDSTPLKGEYTYGNGESVTSLRMRSGRVRHFFFFDNKLWKLYDEHPLKKEKDKDKGLGDSFDSAVAALTKSFKAPPKFVEPDYKQQNFREARWQSNDLNVRLLDRGDVIAIVYENREVANDLSIYRKNKPVDEHALSRDVKSVLKQPDEPPPAQKAEQEAKKKAKGKGKAQAAAKAPAAKPSPLDEEDE